MVDHSIWRKYVSIMESIVGGDIRSRSRKRAFVVGRSLVARQLRIDGWTLERIGIVLNRDHATVSHALDMARDYMIYPDFAEIWSKFQIKINENEEH